MQESQIIVSSSFKPIEENQKRQNSGYGQVGFNYDQSTQNTSEESAKAANENKDEQPDEVYVPHPRFYIPPGMELVRIDSFLFKI